MGNCKFTKLKANTQNDNLPILGYSYIDFSVESPTTFSIDHQLLRAGQTDVFKLTGDAYFTNSNGDNLGNTVDDFTHIHANSGNYKLQIKEGCYRFFQRFQTDNAYNEGVKLDIDVTELSYALEDATQQYDSRMLLYCNTIKGNLSDLFKNDRKYFMLRLLPDNTSPELIGDLSDIILTGDLTNNEFVLMLKNTPNITGNVNTFCDTVAPLVASLLAEGATKVFKLRFTNCPKIIYNSESIGSDRTFIVTVSSNGTYTIA